MFGFFYPENNVRFLWSLSFGSVAEAVEWMRNRRATWKEIESGSDLDRAAFLSPLTGDIIVVRKLAAREVSP